MTTDPYPDELLLAHERVERPELSEADSRLLAALTRPGPAVVTAAEDALSAPTVPYAPRSAVGRAPAAPVFQEPTD